MEISSEDLQTLTEKSARGDTKSYQGLYDHLVDRVYAYLAYRTATKEAATDLTQDVFVELWKALPRFTYHTREQFYAYVFIIVKRQLFALYGKKTKETVPLIEETLSDPKEESVVLKDLIERALQTLDAETREIIVLHHWSRYTFKEIAELISMNESAVRVRHHRALKSLQTQVMKE